MKDELGNEPGFRRLDGNEFVEKGDETFGVLGNEQWTPANDAQIGKLAGKVGGFCVWRRPVPKP